MKEKKELTIPEKIRMMLHQRCRGFNSFDKINGYPKIKYHDFPSRRIYFVEVSKTKRLQEIGISNHNLIYEDTFISVTKEKTFWGKFKEKEFLQVCKNVEKNLPKLLKDIRFYQDNYEKIVPTIEVKQENKNGF